MKKSHSVGGEHGRYPNSSVQRPNLHEFITRQLDYHVCRVSSKKDLSNVLGECFTSSPDESLLVIPAGMVPIKVLSTVMKRISRDPVSRKNAGDYYMIYRKND